MTDFPVVVIYVRHGNGKDGKPCKWEGDEYCRKCDCRKHLRWRQGGKLHRMKANTRSWAQAEQAKRELEDQLSGKADIDAEAQSSVKSISVAAEAFIAEKRVEGVSRPVLRCHTRLTEQLAEFAQVRGVYNVKGLTRDLLTAFVDSWTKPYPSSFTRVLRRTQLRAFLNFCYQNQWLVRVPVIVPVKSEDSPTQPLTDAEYRRLLDAIYCTISYGEQRCQTMKKDAQWQHAVATYIQTMRWTGLAPIDVTTLRRDALTFDAVKGIYHVSRSRNKTGVQVRIPVSKQVGDDLLKVEVGGSAEYFFWSGQSKPQYAATNWGTHYITPCFKAAGIPSTGNMLSYRLRDTFAVHLLERGASMEDVAKLLGNSVAVCERHYAKWSKLRQDKVDAFVTGTFEQAPVKRNQPGRKPKKD